MDMTTVLVYVVFVVIVIWHSLPVWIAPEKFVSKMKRARHILNRYSLGLMMPQSVKDGFDSNPEFEILFAKILFTIIYLLIILIPFLTSS